MSSPGFFFFFSSLTMKCSYNSAVFSALGTHEYGVFLVSADFDFNNPPKNGPDYAHCSEENFSMYTTDFYTEVSKFKYLILRIVTIPMLPTILQIEELSCSSLTT